MTDDEEGFMKQFETCADVVKRAKVTTPEFFPEWIALRYAEEDFAIAKARLEHARNCWKNK